MDIKRKHADVYAREFFKTMADKMFEPNECPTFCILNGFSSDWLSFMVTWEKDGELATEYLAILIDDLLNAETNFVEKFNYLEYDG